MAVGGNKRGSALVCMALFSIVISSWPISATAKLHRSRAALRAFVNQQACPSTGLHRLPCKGWVIDHVKPLACGGADDPSNLQWQTREDAKIKDKWERRECGK